MDHIYGKMIKGKRRESNSALSIRSIDSKEIEVVFVIPERKFTCDIRSLLLS